MSGVVASLLACAVAATWLAAVASLRLTPLARVHAVTFVNVLGGGALTAAALAADGLTPRTLKVLLIWLVLVLTGAVGSHVTGRAIHLRDGERR